MERPIVLVIDLNHDILDMINESLVDHCRVLAASSTLQAVNVLRKGKADVIFIVHKPPDLNGIDCFITLKKEFSSLLPTVFIAKSPTRELIINAFRSGVTDFLIAPLNSDELQSCLRRLQSFQYLQFTDRPKTREKAVMNKAGFAQTIEFIKSSFSNLLGKGKTVTISTDDDLLALSNSADDVIMTLPKTNMTEIPALDKIDHKEENSELSLKCYFLGNFRIVINNQTIKKWSSKKGKSLIAYLLFNHKRRIYRDVLMEKFWPGSDPDSARNCLNVALHGIRSCLKEIDRDNEYILFEEECYFINPEIDIQLDVEKFLRYWSKGQTFEQEKNIQNALKNYELAITSYKGDFFEDDPYEEWTSHERESLKEVYLAVLDRISNYYALNGKPATAISLCEKILQKDNCLEEVHRRIMRCYYRLGRRSRAMKQFQKCAEILKEELEVEPTRTTLNLYEQIKNDAVN